MTDIEFIKQSPYNINVQRAIWVILKSNYIIPKGTTLEEQILFIEDFVISYGIFIGAVSKNGFMYCVNVDDLIYSFWASIMSNDINLKSPSKLFTSTIAKLYKESTLIF